MDKKKQLEEMAKAMLEYGMEKYPTETSVFTEVKLREQFYPVFLTYAEHLYNVGYRKIPENAVVLTRERYEWLTFCFGKFEEIMNDIKKSTRKETAEKFAELKTVWKQRAKEYTDWAGNKVQAVTLDWLFADIDEICKEITEGKDV